MVHHKIISELFQNKIGKIYSLHKFHLKNLKSNSRRTRSRNHCNYRSHPFESYCQVVQERLRKKLYPDFVLKNTSTDKAKLVIFQSKISKDRKMEVLQTPFTFLKNRIMGENTPPPPPKTSLELAVSSIQTSWENLSDSVVTCPTWVWEGLITLGVAYLFYRIIRLKQPRIVTLMRKSLYEVWPLKRGGVAIQTREE